MSPPPPQDPDRWRQIEPILDRALDLEAAERDVFLDTACAGDPTLRAEVMALLAADEGAGNFLGTPAGEHAADLLAADSREIQGEESLTGLLVGPYRILREVGCGGMGVVYEAEDTRLGRRVAVKFLPREYSRDRKAKERFLREARAASAVDHPNLCTVHDVGEWSGRLYTVLTYYEGETLKERLRRGPMSIAEAQDVAIQMVRGLARAHEAGIVHRDIKPSNVILTRRGEVKILDFGIAKLDNEDVTLTPTGSSWGTPAYMSPEQVRGEQVDGRTDIWSLGVVMYEMLTGRRPFGGEGVQEMLSSILIRDPEPLARVRPGVPPALSETVFKALAKDRDQRYARAAELLVDLESGQAPGSPRWGRRRKRAVRSKPLLWVVAALALLALLIGGLLYFNTNDPLRIAITIEAKSDPEIAVVSSEVIETSLSTLLSLRGLQPLDPPEAANGLGINEAQGQRVDEADEEVVFRLDCQDSWCKVSIRRIRNPGREILEKVGPFEVPMELEDAYELAEGIRVNLLKIYPYRRPLWNSYGGRVTPQDYASYIAIKRQVDRQRPGVEDLGRLERLLRTSPDLLSARLLAAEIANGLGARHRDTAINHATQAQSLATRDLRPLLTRFNIELAGGQREHARATLEQLKQLVPKDPRVLNAEADLLEAQGELKAAFPLRQEVAQRRPVWQSILALVTLEFRMGESESARLRLGKLIKQYPGTSTSEWIRFNLAALETCFGDLERAATLYEELIRERPAREYLNSLGFIRYLQGDYTAAEALYRRALLQEEGHQLTRFNLATTLEAQGKLAEAQRLCRTLAQEIEHQTDSPEIRTSMFRTQCLARLGFKGEANLLIRELLEQRLPEDIQMLHQAAQVYALLGDRHSTLHYIEQCLESDLTPVWFTIPEFRSLEEDPEFRDLLEQYGPKPK